MSNWQQELAQGFSSSRELLAYLKLEPVHADDSAEQGFKTKVPKSFAQRMQKRLDDPLLLQVLASGLENQVVEGFVHDPLQEANSNPLPGLIHKYKSRVLLVGASACAIHCRYCFRRHFSYRDNNPGKKGWLAVRDYLKNAPEIDEVILSGGDPLLLNNDYFKYLFDLLLEVSHIKTVRLHSRIPIVLPSRIDGEWLSLMSQYPWQKVMVLHANHAQELDAQVKEAVALLKNTNWLVLNQSVLLKGVNDHAMTLVDLSKRLFSFGVLPYYLHLLDKVKNVAHFEVSKPDALKIYADMQKELPGYLLPKLVQEHPGAAHKTLIL